MRKQILHPTVYLKDRKHEVDIHVYEACSKLWERGIKTFYSCQGGPQINKDGRIVQKDAYIVVRRKDAKKACKALKGFNPEVDNNLLYKRVAIKFDATEAAKNIPLIVEKTKISYEFIHPERSRH